MNTKEFGKVYTGMGIFCGIGQRWEFLWGWDRIGKINEDGIGIRTILFTMSRSNMYSRTQYAVTLKTSKK